MTRCELLLDSIEKSDIMYIRTTSDRLPAHSMRIEDDYAIFFNEAAFETGAARYVSLAHEKTHCDTGTFYSDNTPLMTRGYLENRAWRRTVLDCLPIETLMEAFEACKTYEGVTLYDLSEHLDMPEEFISYAIETYTTMGKKIL